MKIVLDRRTCNCYEPACETHFGSWQKAWEQQQKK